MSTTMQRAAAIEEVEVHAYEVATATDQEMDGTLQWDSTSVVVVLVHCGEHQGLGYTYCHPAAARVIETKLRSLLEQSDPLMPQRTWAAMQVQVRQLGHAGVAAMDARIAMWIT